MSSERRKRSTRMAPPALSMGEVSSVHPRRRRRTVKLPKPFKSRLKYFLKKRRTYFLFLLFIVCFTAIYLVTLHFYWKYQYTIFGHGYVFEN